MRTCGVIIVLIIIKWNLDKRRGHFCRLGYTVLNRNDDQLSSVVGLERGDIAVDSILSVQVDP